MSARWCVCASLPVCLRLRSRHGMVHSSLCQRRSQAQRVLKRNRSPRSPLPVPRGAARISLPLTRHKNVYSDHGRLLVLVFFGQCLRLCFLLSQWKSTQLSYHFCDLSWWRFASLRAAGSARRCSRSSSITAIATASRI